MSKKDELGTRMKIFYEAVSQMYLTRRTPVAIRLDGKAFHTFTRGFDKPFDKALIKTMQETTKYLCEKIQGCVFGYTQSDEITLILIDYQTLTTEAWFGYNVQKICSVSASLATMFFNKRFSENIGETNNAKYQKAAESGAVFDSRCFNIPKEEVTNLIYWRQLDAIRNSIQATGQANFSQKQLNGKNCSAIQKMLIEKDIHWTAYPICQQRGTAVIKDENSKWIIDENMPVLKGDGRCYVDNLII